MSIELIKVIVIFQNLAVGLRPADIKSNLFISTMLSANSWKYCAINWESGYFWYCYSTYLRKKKRFYEVVARTDSRIVKLNTILMLFFNFVAALMYGLIVGTCNSDKVQIKMFFVGMVSVTIFLMGFQFWHVHFMDRLSVDFAKTVKFNILLRK